MRTRQFLDIASALFIMCLSETPLMAVDRDSDPVPVPDGIMTCTFVTGRSTARVVRDSAGLDETCPLEGQFRLSVDLRARTASLLQIDANIISDSPLIPDGNLGEHFGMTAFHGYVIGNTKIAFADIRYDTWSISLTLAFTREGIRFEGDIDPVRTADTDIRIDAFAKYDEGKGEPDNPYRIYTAEQLNAIGSDPSLWDKHFRLMADIDLREYKGDSYHVIGQADRPFSGVFDGNGRTVFGFRCSPTEPTLYVGLFGCVAGPDAQIKNVWLADPNVGCADLKYDRCAYIGSLVGWIKEGTLSNCHAEDAHVFGNWDMGGLVGANTGTVTGCHFRGIVSGPGRSGGLVGINNGAVLASYSCGMSRGLQCSGGLIAINGERPSSDAVSTADVAAVTDCYAMGYTRGGGLIYANYGVIKRCYSTCYVADNRYANRGLVGHSAYNGTTEVSFWDLEASGHTSSVGGEGKTTAEMKTAATFLNAGWDFAGETANGDEDIWWISEGEDYPRLWWERSERP